MEGSASAAGTAVGRAFAGRGRCMLAHMINGQDDEAADRRDEFQRRNAPEKRTGDVQ
jgi:hypothetical protein